ncbi:hypothetical protein LOY35_20745 [Pseudomonas sp. B21-028]|uniref:hypothetical protein n=1 Tax=Pseudomonas sp. B21-028 TaxID=2895480 RepID=UPI00215E5F28|nr:hypothetical protein [Pseudomonas sp. B21-028]UVL82612.1 hypothetical protein LOY35_20745 [Pseudomonas sp. B21-028]
MRRRSAQYWLWVDRRLPGKIYNDLLDDGRQVEVQARLTLERGIQVFIGVYAADGAVICEELHDRHAGEKLACALAWGVQQARSRIMQSERFKAPHRPQFTLGPVIVDEVKLMLRRVEMGERERLRLQAQDAWDEYVEAKEAMLDLMRQSRVDQEAWAQCQERLRQAIDRRTSIQRVYLQDTLAAEGVEYGTGHVPVKGTGADGCSSA